MEGTPTNGEIVRDGEKPVIKYSIRQYDKKGDRNRYFIDENYKLGFYTPDDKEHHRKLKLKEKGDEEE